MQLVVMMMAVVMRLRVILNVRVRVLRVSVGGHVGVCARVNVVGDGLGIGAVQKAALKNRTVGWRFAQRTWTGDVVPAAGARATTTRGYKSCVQLDPVTAAADVSVVVSVSVYVPVAAGAP